MPCPAGLFFNPVGKYGYCDYPKNVDCHQYQGDVCYGATKNRYLMCCITKIENFRKKVITSFLSKKI